MMRKRRRKKKQHELNVFDKILIAMALFILAFAIIMIVIFCMFQSVPDALVVAVFGLAGSECGFMAWIERKSQETEKKDDE